MYHWEFEKLNKLQVPLPLLNMSGRDFHQLMPAPRPEERCSAAARRGSM